MLDKYIRDPELSRIATMPTINLVIFSICLLSLPALAWWLVSATSTTYRRYPPSWIRDEGPVDDRERRTWTRRGRQAWATIAMVASVLIFDLYIVWWMLIADRAILPDEAVLVHGVRMAAGFFLALAFWPTRDRGQAP